MNYEKSVLCEQSVLLTAAWLVVSSPPPISSVCGYPQWCSS